MDTETPAIPPVPPRKNKVVSINHPTPIMHPPEENQKLQDTPVKQPRKNTHKRSHSLPQPDFSMLTLSGESKKQKDKDKDKDKDKFKKEKKKTKFPIGAPSIGTPFKTILKKIDLRSSDGAPPPPPPPPPVAVDTTNIVRVDVYINSVQNEIVLEQRTKDLLDLLLGPNMLICKALLSIGTVRNIKFLWRALPMLFVYGGKVNELITPFIREEVQRTEEKSTLFRGADWTSKLISSISTLLGNDFLVRVLSEPFKQLADMIDNECYFEVNPMNCDPSILPQNIQNLLTICNSFLNSIITHCEYLPKTLKNICRLLREESAEKFPNGKDFIIGGFFFLRFVCPAIVSPQSFNIIDPTKPMSPAFRRALVLISKIIQNLSNGVEFGKKEEYMAPFNDFILSNLPQVSHLFDYYSCEDNLCPNNELYTIDIDLNLIEDLTFFLLHNQAFIISEILQFTNKDIPLLDAEIARIHSFSSVYMNSSN